MNNWTVEGNLVEKVTYVPAEGDAKAYAYGKIGIYNGKDKEGKARESMFVAFVIYGRDAEYLRDLSNKGDRLLISGSLSEGKTEKDGKEYINKKVFCNSAALCVKRPKSENGYTGGTADPTAW
jgi:single-stranded DNA-binding protein